MLRSLVGSEMCIRDSPRADHWTPSATDLRAWLSFVVHHMCSALSRPLVEGANDFSSLFLASATLQFVATPARETVGVQARRRKKKKFTFSHDVLDHSSCTPSTNKTTALPSDPSSGISFHPPCSFRSGEAQVANHLCKVFTKTTLRTPCNVYLPHRVSPTPDKVTLCNLCTQQMLYAPSTTPTRGHRVLATTKRADLAEVLRSIKRSETNLQVVEKCQRGKISTRHLVYPV